MTAAARRKVSRNAIISDYTSVANPSWGGLAVDAVSIKNIYRKGVGIYSTGTGHSAANTITNSSFDSVGTDPTLLYEGTFAIAAFQADLTIDNVDITNSAGGVGTNYFDSEAAAGQLLMTRTTYANSPTGVAKTVAFDVSGLADGSVIGSATAGYGNSVDITGATGQAMGIVVQYVITGANVTVQGNSVTADAGNTAIMLYADADSSHPVAVIGNTVTRTGAGSGGAGILVTDDGSVFGETAHAGNTYATLMGNHVTGFANAVSVTAAGSQVARVEFGAGNVLTNGGTGLRISGSASVVGNTLAGTAFGGQTDDYVALTNGALAGETLDGTGASFGGVSGGNALTAALAWPIEDKISDALDAGGVGYVQLRSGHVFVTQTSGAGAIARGVAVAADADALEVQNGLYREANVGVDHAVRIVGESRTGVIISPSLGDSHDESQFGGAAVNNAFVIQHDDVTIESVTIDGNANGAVNTSVGHDQNFRVGVVTDYNNGAYGGVKVNDVQMSNIFRKGVGLYAGGANHTAGNEVTNSFFDHIGNYSTSFEGTFAIAGLPGRHADRQQRDYQLGGGHWLELPRGQRGQRADPAHHQQPDQRSADLRRDDGAGHRRERPGQRQRDCGREQHRHDGRHRARPGTGRAVRGDRRDGHGRRPDGG